MRKAQRGTKEIQVHQELLELKGLGANPEILVPKENQDLQALLDQEARKEKMGPLVPWV